MSGSSSHRPVTLLSSWRWRRRLAVLAVMAVLGSGCGADKGEKAVETPTEPPSPDVVALVDGVLTAEGRRLFYAAHPRILGKAEFDIACPSNSELTLVLGCFSQGSIFILRVDKPELAPVMEVTAAHEMLHAAYVALSDRDRREVDGLIDQFYATVSDPAIHELVTEYDRQGPRRRLNELHSILPTEILSLNAPLEDHYRRYLANRTRVVEAHESYETIFRNLKAQVSGLHRDIDELRAQLDGLEAGMRDQRASLENLNSQLDGLRAQGNLRAYNALIPQQNALVDEYNASVDRFNGLVAVHNERVRQVNELALEQDQLASSLGSKPTISAAGAP